MVMQIYSLEKGNIDERDLKSRIWYFLNSQDKMVLAYTNEAGEPVQSYMLYVVDDDFNIYFGTLKRFAKYEALINNPPLSIFVAEEKEKSLVAVTIKATIIKEYQDKSEINILLKEFDRKNSCKYFIKDQDDFVAFKAKILSARMIDGSQGKLLRYDYFL